MSNDAAHTVANAMPPITPASSIPAAPPARGVILAGWLCFGIGIFFVLVPIPFTCFIYSPLLTAAFILSIVALAQNRIGNGLALLLCTVLAPPLAWFLSWVIGLLLLGGAAAVAR